MLHPAWQPDMMGARVAKQVSVLAPPQPPPALLSRAQSFAHGHLAKANNLCKLLILRYLYNILIGSSDANTFVSPRTHPRQPNTRDIFSSLTNSILNDLSGGRVH